MGFRRRAASESIVVAGRPLRRVNGSRRVARSRRGHSHLTDRLALRLTPPVRKALGDHWRAQGEMEHASVVAFRDLARRLASVGAPPDLAERSLRAADRKADHAQRCFDLAGRYLGQNLLPGRIHRPVRLRRSRETELTRLAVDAVRDGLNDSHAALFATGRAERATDPRVRDTLCAIARDEAEHVALSALVLTWCLAGGDADVVTAVVAAAARLPAVAASCVIPPGIDATALANHGLFDPDGVRAANGSGYAEVLASTRACIAAATTPAAPSNSASASQLLRNRRTANGARMAVSASDHAIDPHT